VINPRRGGIARVMRGKDMTLFRKIISTNAPASVIFIRLVVGAVFLAEGIQKFLFPAEVGAGRFAKIGIPNPDVMGPFVGVVETVCGVLILLGLLTRLAAVPLIINMLVAIVSTKVPILLGHGFWGLLWKVAQQTPFIAAGLIGVIGTLVFAATVEERYAS
jgi:putative oxidoreductase